jgi:hypothetical protein
MAMPDDSVKISVVLDAETDKALRIYAATMGESKTSVVAGLVSKFLKQQKAKEK